MYTIKVNNVNEALQTGLLALREHGVFKPSRNGPTKEFPAPVCTTYTAPWRRVLFDPTRDANPFFHFMESLWMLAGRNDVAFLSRYNSRIKDYSDDGTTFHGAYGHRLRVHHSDQLADCIKMLRTDPTTRRCVAQIWDRDIDSAGGKDLPCNDFVMFLARGDKLDMTVCNRSNDVIWGAYGANAVHFSVIHEFVAYFSGLQLGHYHQVSNSFHVYESNPYWQQWTRPKWETDLYINDEQLSTMPPCSLFGTIYGSSAIEQFDKDLGKAFHNFDTNGKFIAVSQFTAIYTGCIMDRAWQEYKKGDHLGAIQILHGMPPGMDDWKRVCLEWVKRRQDKAKEAA